jgi:hypothetical protein
MAGWQPSLLDGGEAGFDPGFTGARRRELAGGAWVDEVPGWLHGADALFADLLDRVAWRSRTVRMYDREVVEPRLVARWRLDDDALPLPVLRAIGDALSGRYGVRFVRAAGPRSSIQYRHDYPPTT